MSPVLVTGANGFVGHKLCNELMASGYKVRAALRQPCTATNYVNPQTVIVGEIGQNTDWEKALTDTTFVIHLAARVNPVDSSSINQLTDFQEINCAGTLQLATQAATLGVTRFIYVSSIKVHGETTHRDHPFSPDDLPNPQDYYSLSKTQAEAQLLKLCIQKGMELVIIRPPLVYGPNLKGNLLLLIKLIQRGLPLPLALVNNRRSMVFLDNLIDFVIRCLEHPKAANESFLVSDGNDWSTPELIRNIAHQLGVPDRLFPVPLSLLRLAGILTMKSSSVHRLCDSLHADISKTQELIEWVPPQTPEEGIQKTINWYLGNKND